MSEDYLNAPGAAMTLPERQYLHDLAVQTAAEFGPDCIIVNIGVALGCSCRCLRAGAPQAHLIGIDINPEAYHGDFDFIRADSRRFHLPPPVHLIFIDGAHDYAAVRSDIKGWATSVASGGWLTFHDYGNSDAIPWTAGVKQAVDEWIQEAEGWEDLGVTGSIRAFRRR